MAKDEQSLAKSRANRSAFIAEYGMVPHSIIKHDMSDKAIDLSATSKSYASTANINKIKDADQKQKIQFRSGIFKVSGQGSRSGALSRFPQNIGRFMVKFYCPENGTVYDPFAGHNSRMQLVYEVGRNYIGVDVCSEFMQANRQIKETLLTRNKRKLMKSGSYIRLFEQSSSNKVPLGSCGANYTITSPPYWDIEYYGPEDEQLGKSKTFDEFMRKLKAHIAENYRILKPGAYCTWFVNDFVKNKVFYCYHAELIRVFLEVGFTLHDIVIVDLGQPITAAFIETIKITKRAAKRHEYAITFRKE